MILVGHSYGEAVITEAGNDPKVGGRPSLFSFEKSRKGALAAGKEQAAADALASARAAFWVRQLCPDGRRFVQSAVTLAGRSLGDGVERYSLLSVASPSPFRLSAIWRLLAHMDALSDSGGQRRAQTSPTSDHNPK